MLLMKAFCRNKAQAGDPRSRADRRLASFHSMRRSGAEDEVLTSRLSRGSQLCLCQIPFQQEGAEIGECVDVVAEADIAAGELDAAVDVFVFFTGNQRADGFCRAIFCLDLYGNQ